MGTILSSERKQFVQYFLMLSFTNSEQFCERETSYAYTLVLPLSEEVGESLIDYLRNGRPPVTCREVFVRHLAPLQPFAHSTAFYRMITRYSRKACIRMDVSRCRGLHALRYTLATRMLEQETPIETIAAVLGHNSVESTLVYTRVNLKLLRSAALDPEEVGCKSRPLVKTVKIALGA